MLHDTSKESIEFRALWLPSLAPSLCFAVFCQLEQRANLHRACILNKGVDYSWMFNIHTQTFRSYACFNISQISPLVQWIYFPPLLFISSLPSHTHYEIHGLLWKRWCGVWAELSKRVPRKQGKPWMLEWNGWLGRTFGFCRTYLRQCMYVVVRSAGLAEGCYIESKLFHFG